MMDNKTLQRALALAGYYKGNIDGFFYGKSQAATREFLRERKHPEQLWSTERCKIALEQIVLVDLEFYPRGEVDGLVGPDTLLGRELWQNSLRTGAGPMIATPLDPVREPVKSTIWPKQSGVPTVFGTRGANQIKVPAPWGMVLAWDHTQKVKTISLHERVAESAQRVFAVVNEAYSHAEKATLGLHLFGGSLNVRKMRGGTNWSMHSWGIAIDFDPARNALRTPFAEARLGQHDANGFWDAWASEGWVSLGRERGFDSMHVQAARI